MKLHINYY